MINLTYEGKTYELTFTREIVMRMEQAGFEFNAFVRGEKPLTNAKMLFDGAFAARCDKVKRKVKDEIYEHLDKESRSDLIVALATEFADTVESMSEGADDGKKATWTTV